MVKPTASLIATSTGTSSVSSSCTRDAERAALDGAEPVGSPPLGRRGDPRVELGGSLGNRLGNAARPGVDLARVLRADRLAGEIPLVEQEERLAASLTARDRHAVTSARSASSVEVE